MSRGSDDRAIEKLRRIVDAELADAESYDALSSSYETAAREFSGTARGMAVAAIGKAAAEKTEAALGLAAAVYATVCLLEADDDAPTQA